MFTIKYRSYQLAPTQPADSDHRFYNEHEMIQGPFVQVSQEVDDLGYRVVHAHVDFESPGMTFGPVRTDEAGKPRPVVWVMNESGATVAKYDL